MNDILSSGRLRLVALVLLSLALASGSALWLRDVLRHGEIMARRMRRVPTRTISWRISTSSVPL